MNWNQLTYRLKSLSIAEKLMALNGVFFVLPFVLQTIFYLFELPISGLLSWFQLSADAELLLFRPWTLISYSFYNIWISFNDIITSISFD